MYDEDTGEEIRCPYCGSDEDCPHLLVLFDRTFGECLGGYAFGRYEELEGLIQEAFLELLERGTPEKYSWSDPDIAELWANAMEQYTPGDDDVWLDDGVFLGVLSDILNTRHDRINAESDEPGGLSAVDLFYVLEPEKAFETALADLRLHLRSALIEVSAEG